MWAKYWLPCYCTRDSLYFEMQHILKKLNFDLLTALSGSGAGSAGKLFATMLLHSCFPLFCLFDLILYVLSTIFQLNRDGSSWAEPVLS